MMILKSTTDIAHIHFDQLLAALYVLPF